MLPKIIIYDADCVLCNFWIKFLLKGDKKNLLLFTPMYSNLAKHLLKNYHKTTDFQLNSIVVFYNGMYYTKFEAILVAIKDLGFGYNVLAFVSNIFPIEFKNWIYDIVAKNRYNWFGIKKSCEMLPPKFSRKIITNSKQVNFSLSPINEK